MKNAVYSLVGLLGIGAVVLVAWLMFANNNFVPADDAAVPEERIVDAVPAAEQTDTGAEADESAPSILKELELDELETSMPAPHFNSGLTAEMVLDTAFPETPASGKILIYQQPDPLTTEEMDTIIAQLGIEGSLYQQVHNIPEEEAAAMAEMMVEMPNEYVVIDGNTRLSFHGGSVSMYDMSNMRHMPPTGDEKLPFDEAAEIVTNKLNELDALDYEHEMRRRYGNEIEVLEYIDGSLIDRPRANVSLDVDGNIVGLHYQYNSAYADVGSFDVMSAEDAWNSFIADPGRVEMDYMPDDEMMMEPPYNHWQREYSDNSEVTLNTWFEVYEAIDGTHTVLFADGYIIEGDDSLIAELIAQENRSVLLTGNIFNEGDTRRLVLTSWQTAAQMSSDVNLNGIVERDGDTVTLVVAGGLTMIIPDAPAELEAGANIHVYGRSIDTVEGSLPVINWMNIDQMPSMEEMQAFEEKMGGMEGDMGPYGAESITFNKISLAHRYYWIDNPTASSLFDEETAIKLMESGEMFAPYWQFTGETNGGQEVSFFVPALADS